MCQAPRDYINIVFKIPGQNLHIHSPGIPTASLATASIVIGSPTVLAGAHPAVVGATYLVNALRPKTKFASIIGSYGWGGRTVEQIRGMLTNLKVEMLEPVVIRGYPEEQDFKSLDRLADEILEKHRTLTEGRV